MNPNTDVPNSGAEVDTSYGSGSDAASATESPVHPNGGAPEHETLFARIARRAYELFQDRGGEHGRHEEDWLTAERELGSEESPRRSL